MLEPRHPRISAAGRRATGDRSPRLRLTDDGRAAEVYDLPMISERHALP
ncbi:MAG: hypothetical protein WCO00_17585 [Rhodospirillaceae bacterium]